ncbi:MAG: hypothetical protein ACRD25_09185 [Terracidiphilus sp.]
MGEEIFDVVLQPTMRFPVDQHEWETLPPIGIDFFLESEFWIGVLPCNVTSDSVIEAYSPAGFNFHPSRHTGYRYAFCRKVYPPNLGPEHLRWDHDGVIRKTLFLSRLIHPTTACPQYSARLFVRDGELKMVVPGPIQGDLTHIWIVAKQWRDWLTREEGEQLRSDMQRFNWNSPPERVRRARSHIDHAFRAFYLDQRTASLVSGFESLLKVQRYAATAQFKLRVPVLARTVGSAITSDEAEALYDDRSVYVHGRTPNYTDVSDGLIERYNKFETVLRSALLRASTDATFGNLFATDGTVTSNFGVLP